MNEHAAAGTKLKNKPRLDESSEVETVVDRSGYITIEVNHCSTYVVLPERPKGGIVASLLEQVGVPIRKTLTLGKTQKIAVVLPIGTEDARVTYTSDNKKVVIVDKEGKITAKGAGTAAITTKVTIDGRTKSYKTKITVKKPILFQKD